MPPKSRSSKGKAKATTNEAELPNPEHHSAEDDDMQDFDDDLAPENQGQMGQTSKEAPGEETSSDAKRRARLRRAQRAFRQRKEETLKALNARVNLLEGVIEKMSAEVMTFSDQILKSGLLRQNTEVGESFQTMVRTFLDLAHSVNQDVEHSADEDESLHPIEESSGSLVLPNKPWRNEAASEALSGIDFGHLTGWHVNSDTLASVKLPRGDLPESSNRPVASQRPTRRSAPPSQTIPLAMTMSWLNPAWEQDSGIRNPTWTLSPAEEQSIAVRLLRKTFSVGYHALEGSHGYSKDLAMQIFGHMGLAEHPQLFSAWLKRCLAHNWTRIPVANQSNTDKLPAQAYTRIDFESEMQVFQRIWKSAVDTQLQQEPLDILDADGVEAYLLSKGATKVDQDTLRLTLNLPGFPIPADQSSGSSTQESMDWYNKCASSSSADTTISSGMHTVTVNVPRFLEEMATASTCLGDNCGYRRELINTAILKSIIDVRAS